MKRYMMFLLLPALLSCEKDENPTSNCKSNNGQVSMVKSLLISKQWVVTKYQWEDCMSAFTFEPKNGADKICILEYGYVSSELCEEVGDKEIEWVSYELNFTPSEMEGTFIYHLTTYDSITGSTTTTNTESFSSKWSIDECANKLEVNFGQILTDYIGQRSIDDLSYKVFSSGSQKIVLVLDFDYVSKCPASLRVELE